MSETTRPEIPYPISYWVEPGRLLAGEYPIVTSGRTDGYAQPYDDRERLRRLLGVAGVTVFFDLTEDGELPPYLPQVRAEATSLGQPVEHIRFPIQNWTVPPVDLLNGALDALDGALARGETIYIHCRAGVGRTGTVVGAHLVRHGLTGAAALDRIAALRMAVPDGHLSPLREGQRALVRRWAELDARLAESKRMRTEDRKPEETS
jgi:protein-tyrosine phosphatase